MKLRLVGSICGSLVMLCLSVFICVRFMFRCWKCGLILLLVEVVSCSSGLFWVLCVLSEVSIVLGLRLSLWMCVVFLVVW